MRETVSGRVAGRVGVGPTGVTNVGEGDVGARLTVAEGVTLREVSAGEVTSECRDSDRGARKLPPETWEERDSKTSAYCGTYCAETKTADENA